MPTATAALTTRTAIMAPWTRSAIADATTPAAARMPVTACAVGPPRTITVGSIHIAVVPAETGCCARPAFPSPRCGLLGLRALQARYRARWRVANAAFRSLPCGECSIQHAAGGHVAVGGATRPPFSAVDKLRTLVKDLRPWRNELGKGPFRLGAEHGHAMAVLERQADTVMTLDGPTHRVASHHAQQLAA